MPHPYIRHIHTCNRLAPTPLKPLFIGNSPVALTHPKAQDALQHTLEFFTETATGWHMHDSCMDFTARSHAFEILRQHLFRDGNIGPTRRELYTVAPYWGASLLATADRSVATILGIPAFGVHINGYVRRNDDIYMWIGRRSRHKPVAPGKLDNIVAGGQPAGLSLRENVLKESHEEASLPRHVAEQAKLTSLIRYSMSETNGTRFDTLFCYDLELPDTVIPTPCDDECEGFSLMPMAQVLSLIATTDDFKFNVPLVILDFAIRHGIVTSENTPNYVDLCMGLRRPFPAPFTQPAC